MIGIKLYTLNVRAGIYVDEIVHHVNGIKDDNRIENLFLVDRFSHMRKHKIVVQELEALKLENILLRQRIIELESIFNYRKRSI